MKKNNNEEVGEERPFQGEVNTFEATNQVSLEAFFYLFLSKYDDIVRVSYEYLPPKTLGWIGSGLECQCYVKIMKIATHLVPKQKC